jgi:hypothetical protein
VGTHTYNAQQTQQTNIVTFRGDSNPRSPQSSRRGLTPDTAWQPRLVRGGGEQITSSKLPLRLIHIYNRVSFCDGSFYDDSLLRPLSSRTEHSRLVVRYCRNSGNLSLLSVLTRSFPVCMCFLFFFFFVQVFLVDCNFFYPLRPSKRQQRRKNQNS